MPHWTAVVVQCGAWRQTERGPCWPLAARMVRCVQIDDVNLRGYLLPLSSFPSTRSPFFYSLISLLLPPLPSRLLPIFPFFPLILPSFPFSCLFLSFSLPSLPPPLPVIPFHDVILTSLLRFICLTLPLVGEVSRQYGDLINKRDESSPLLGIPQGSSSQSVEQTAQFGKWMFVLVDVSSGLH